MAGQVTFLSPLIHCRDFLPRGSGIVTRRPLVLQLVNASTGTCPPQPGWPLQPPTPPGEARHHHWTSLPGDCGRPPPPWSLSSPSGQWG